MRGLRHADNGRVDGQQGAQDDVIRGAGEQRLLGLQEHALGPVVGRLTAQTRQQPSRDIPALH